MAPLARVPAPGPSAADSTREPELAPERCYRALASRDPRFDGRFFTGVRTTGVYCRPICPARTPRLPNVRFYVCAAAAEAAGFRPCRRCRPEAAPGTPAWLGTSATVARALRHIEAGALDAAPVEALAARLGIGERHLRRLFLRHLGAAPLAVAQTRRLHFARKLLDETSLPMTRVAFEAGYASVRRFNAAVKQAYGRSPRELRAGRGRTRLGGAGQIQLRLPFRPPFDLPRLLSFLALRAIPGVEVVDAAGYRRSVRIPAPPGQPGAGARAGVIRVAAAGDAAALELCVPHELSPGLAKIAHGMRRLFDLGADPREIGSLLRRDADLARRLRRAPGLRVPGAYDGFELAVRAILGQQVTVRGATTLAGRLVARFGVPLASAGAGPMAEADRPATKPDGPSQDPAENRLPGPTHLFPEPERLAEAGLEEIGLPGARADAIRGLAAAVAEGRLDLDGSVGLDAAVAGLEALPGVGPWTAHYVAMRALGEPDAFPASDLGLRKALADGARPLTPAALATRAEAWRPWRAYAAMALWCV